MKDFTKEIEVERARARAKYGNHNEKSMMEWRHVFTKQLGDMTIILENGGPKARFRREVIQLAAATMEALENSAAW